MHDKILFYHNPKTGGSSVRSALRESGIKRTHKIWDENARCSAIKFLENTKQGLAMSHCFRCNKGKWPGAYDFISHAHKAGWYTFTFMREPVDQLLSWHFYMHRPGSRRANLDPEKSLNKYFAKKRNLVIPEFVQSYEKFNFIATISDKHINKLFSELGLVYKTRRSNSSANKGAEYYIKKGLLDPKLIEPIVNSIHAKIYDRIKELNSIGKYNFL